MQRLCKRLLSAAILLAALALGAETPKSGQSIPAVPQASAAVASSLAAVAAAEKLGARLAWDPLTGSGVLEKSGDRLAFALDSGFALWNYSELLAIDPPRLRDLGPSFSQASYSLMEKRFTQAQAARRSHFSVAAILIDPGHGGKDSGAVGEHSLEGKRLRVVEKELALDVSKRVYEALKKRYPDRNILISRSGDSYPTLEERVEMANRVELADNEAIIYISIHANASFNKNARGYEVWYLNPDYRRTLLDGDKAKGLGEDIAPILNAMLEEEFTTESIILARNILGGLEAGVGTESPNRGVRAEEWFVVRNARMPSVLVELGFVTNPEEAALLSREDYLRRLSEGIYNGLVEFLGYFETMKGPAVQ